MATTPQQGIMALPETDQASAPELSIHESYGAAKQGLSDADPNFLAMYDNEMSKAMPALLTLSDEQLDMLLKMVQYLQENPEEYKKRLAEMEQAGAIDKGDFPEEYDENFLAVFGAAVIEAQKTNQPAAAPQGMQPPMQLAKGGIAEAARMVASHGRYGDTMLAHINKDEAALLKAHGGSGTINPRTGLPEFFSLSSFNPVNVAKSVIGGATDAVKSAVKSVGSAVKTVLSSSVGRIVATVALAAFIGPAAFGLTGAAGVAAQMGLATAGISALSGGNLKDVVRAGTTGAVLGYGGAALGPAIAPTAGATTQAALGAGLTGAGVGVATGKSIQDSVKDGLASAAVAGAMTYANTEGVSRGTQGQDPSKVPVEDRVLTPDQAGKVNVSQQTGEVTGGAPAPAVAGPVSNMSTEPGITVKPTSADPLGEFMAQNDKWRQYASAPATTPEPSMWDSTKQFYNDNISPSGRAQAGLADAKATALEGYKADIAAGVPESIAAQNYQAALKAATPGIMGTYGPAIATGLGITALAGGFNQKQPEMPQADKDMISGKATQDLISANPKNYITQNMPGVTYDAAGNITGSAPWTPRSGSGTTEVAGDYIAYKPTSYAAAPAYTPAPTYVAPTGAIGGGRQIFQPYNTASMYDFRPRHAAQGGMMETQGAFPSNPLSMPSSPLMAMDSQRLPMNTPGVPMNTPGVPMNMPMGLAQGGMPAGGIATLATGGYPRRTGQIAGPGTETSDDIPAMLSDGEFVMTAKAVRGMGQGSRRAGAKKMYALMHHLEKNAARG